MNANKALGFLGVFLVGLVLGFCMEHQTAKADTFPLETYVDRDLHRLLNQHADKLDAVEVRVDGMESALNVLCAKLDADGGVTDVNYGSNATITTVVMATHLHSATAHRTP
jgi:maltodextrin utilization protein YvdJ